MGGHRVVVSSAMDDLLELLADPEGFQARLQELRDVTTQAAHAVAQAGLAKDIETLKAQAESDRQMAAGELAQARQEARRIVDGAQAEIEAGKREVSEGRRRLAEATAEHAKRVSDFDNDARLAASSAQRRQQSLDLAAAELDAQRQGLAQRERDLEARAVKIAQAAELVRG